MKNGNIEITLVSKDNFLLFTPMLPEVAFAMIETRHIVTPVREFC
jgi:NADH dehydrogenase